MLIVVRANKTDTRPSTHTHSRVPVYTPVHSWCSLLSGSSFHLSVCDVREFKEESFVFDLVVFVYIFLVLCSKDVCLGLLLFQSIYKLKI